VRDGRLPHNTLSVAKRDVVVVHYPFHPLHGQQLQVFVSSRSQDGAVTVEDANQKRLKIPGWMVMPDAAGCHVNDTPTIHATALLQLAELWELHRDKLSNQEVHSHRELDHEATLVDQAAVGKRVDADSSTRSGNA
jgi:hypothetical protein